MESRGAGMVLEEGPHREILSYLPRAGFVLMSTKQTIKYSEDDEGAAVPGFHLYTEMSDDNNVYLRLDCVHVSVDTKEDGAEVTLTLPLELARTLGLIS